VTAVYKVKVELQNVVPKLNRRKKFSKKLRTKKYNVPLKRQSMKLSNFEILLRKLAEENSPKLQNYDSVLDFTSTKPSKAITYKPIQLKYKPIVARIKTNYTKRIKPVRSKIITLTS
jgi:hypothetical protein